MTFGELVLLMQARSQLRRETQIDLISGITRALSASFGGEDYNPLEGLVEADDTEPPVPISQQMLRQIMFWRPSDG